MKMMKPNKYNQTVQELQTYNTGSFVIPEEFQKEGMNNHYICIGIKVSDSKDGMSKVHRARIVTAGLSQWQRMKKQVKSGMFKREFAGIYDKIVILHDPTLKPKKEEPKIKALSPKHKKAVNDLIDEGKSIDEIASLLEVDLERVKAYLA